MVKDPLDNGQTQEMEFEPEIVPMEVEPVPTAPPEFTPPSADVIAKAKAALRDRTFAQRNDHLGKMHNCPVCGTRHRGFGQSTYREKRDENGRKTVEVVSLTGKCEQVFTQRSGDYLLYREDEHGNVVPAYRTAIPVDQKPTARQVIGAAAFAKKRFNPHMSAAKNLLVERTRQVFEALKFPLEDTPENFAKNLETAKKKALRQLRAEKRAERRRRRLERKSARKAMGL